MLKSFALRIVSVLLTVVLLLYVGVCDHAAYDVKEPQACRLHFTVLSDVHIEGNNPMRYKVFAKALQDIEKNTGGNDAVVFLGDNTMNGHFFENLLFHGGVRTLLRGETVLPVMGNHDIGNGSGNYEALRSRWFTFTNAFFGRQPEHPYYYEVIDGCYFIVLGPEAQRVHEMVMSEAQFAWLEDVLAKAAESGKPAFVFSHYPTNYAADADGRDTTRLTDMLSAYNREHDVFCFVGHTHMPLRLSRSFRTSDGFAQTYLPRLTELSGENDNVPYNGTGLGVTVEVYEDALVIRARDFYRGEWKYEGDTPCEVTYPLHAAQEN